MLKVFFAKSIRRKILALVLSMVVLLGVILSIATWETMNDLMGEQLEKRGREIGLHVSALAGNQILVDNSYALYEILRDTVRNNEDVRYILVGSHDRRLLAHTFNGGLPAGLWSLNTLGATGDPYTVLFDSNEGLVRDVLQPIEKGAVGFVRVGITERHAYRLIIRYLRNNLLLIASMCVFASLIAAGVAKLISRPVVRLAAAAGEISRGNLTVRSEVVAQDEIGVLAETFDNMASSLYRSDQARQELLAMLQEKEAVRTDLLQKLLTAQEDERKRISRELHDETSQALTSLLISIHMLTEKAENEQQKKLLLEIRDIVADILDGVRNLAVELRPAMLDEIGLIAALGKYFAGYSAKYALAVDFNHEGDFSSCPSEIAMAIYRIMQECLTNIVKHAKAGRVTVRIERTEGRVIMVIRDDGRGMSQKDIDAARRDNRLGIYGMRERAEILGGRFAVISDGNGTAISVEIPL